MMHRSNSEPIQFQRFSGRVRKAKVMLKHAAQGERWPNDGNLAKLATKIALKRLAHVFLHGMLGNRVPGIRRVLKDTNRRDRKSTRLNSSHQIISYAVFCLKK